LHQSGHIREARDLYDKMLPGQQNNAQLLYLLGLADLQSGQLEQGVALMRRSLALDPANPAAHMNIGLALQALLRWDEALASYDQALAIKPDYAEAHHNRGNVLQDFRRWDDALASYDRGLAIDPENATAHHNRGIVLRELGRLDQALAGFDTALTLKPDYAQAHHSRGLVLQKLKRLDEALASYDKAVALDPDNADTYSNRGALLRDLKRLDEALASYDKALAIKPDFAGAYSNRGSALRELGRLDEALASLEKALAIAPEFADAYFNKSVLFLSMGRYCEGWSLYEWRLRQDEKKDFYYVFRKAAWRGEGDIAGRKLLIHAEQGFGDFIQFCRYLPRLHRLGAELIVEVPKRLMNFVSTLDCPMSLVEKGKPLPDFDAYCPMMSLPYAFKTTAETVPAKTPYLFGDAKKVRRWQDRLGRKVKPRIGLAWSGSKTNVDDLNRSIPLEDLLPLVELPSVEWHSLQKEYRQPDLEILRRHPEIRQHQDEFDDFSDTAALVECLDLVISVDTSVAHVAGAMGKPLWLLLSYAADWRWIRGRTDSPWYPTAKLYRQPKRDDWQSVIAAVGADLVRFK
jgi:tetratricopeptide (TPR) repeat protein